MDETDDNGEFRCKMKVFSESKNHHCGGMANVKGLGRHLKAVLIASASGPLEPFCL